MCRPSCCSKSTGDGAGITAVAVVTGAAIVAVKTGPVVARILHLIVEALTIITLTAATALACILLGWLTVRIVRWRLAHYHAHRPASVRPVPAVARQHIKQANDGPGCLACGDTGTVLRAISGSRYQARPCPACEPAQQAG